ncbi:MAG TPA: sulfotransferase [Ktedonobacter sp.]|nr:sulfotransferase [Ktedonobacter sp.]
MKPNFFVVGAARSGTTSLDRYLSQHPDIFITSRKDAHFFAAEHFPCTGPGDEVMKRKVMLDEAEYTQLFADVTEEKAVGESSAFYLCLPGTAERIAQAVPDAKIIMMLREPAERAYSAYMLLVRDGRETLSFEEGLSREEERKQQGFEPMWWYKDLSLYSSQIQHYLDVFGKEHVKVILYEEFYANPGQALREIFAFLGVREDVVINTSVRYNMAGVPRSRRLHKLLYKLIDNPNSLAKRIKPGLAWKVMSKFLLRPASEMSPQTKAQLKAYFAEDVEKLEDLLQQDLHCWQYRERSTAQKS